MRKEKQVRLAEKRSVFEALVAEHEAALLRYVARILHDADLAQDVVQNALVKLFRRWRDVVKPGVNIGNWLYRVAHNEAVDCIRKRQRRQLLHFKQGVERQTLEHREHNPLFRENHAREKVQAALEALDMRERQVVLLKIYEEKSYREISDITGLSSGNVGYILHHAIKKMAARLSDAEKQAKDIEYHEKQSET